MSGTENLSETVHLHELLPQALNEILWTPHSAIGVPQARPGGQGSNPAVTAENIFVHPKVAILLNKHQYMTL